MSVKTYNDYLRTLLQGVLCVLAYETAADYLGLTNGGYREKVQVFISEKKELSNNIEQNYIGSLSKKEYQEVNGLLCTPAEQTIVDLLEKNGDEQIITESLANYYEKHGQCFDSLQIPLHLKKLFQKYSEWAKVYFEE